MIRAELITCRKCKKDLPEFDFTSLKKRRGGSYYFRCDDCRGVRRRPRVCFDRRQNLEENGTTRADLQPESDSRSMLFEGDDKLERVFRDVFRK